MSLWQCTAIGTFTDLEISDTRNSMERGDITPTVSGMSIRSAPASATLPYTFFRKSRSLLVASSHENCTFSPWSLAYCTAETALSRTWSFVILSFLSRWMSEVAMNV